MQVEVLESAWKTFIDDVTAAKSLDEIRLLQQDFSQQILNKALLSNSRIEIYKHIIKIFELIHKYKFIQDVLYSSAVEELQNRESLRRNMEDSKQDIVGS